MRISIAKNEFAKRKQKVRINEKIDNFNKSKSQIFKLDYTKNHTFK